ncbi:MAG: NADH-quinone oxidoreductase subunit C [Rhodothermaceae bacterium]|nr:MAG: NADH-quinone oxidoreductase subunit C [Rhodothermaceae bacterium]GIV61556.1 MAG: NADH-quinone oxidoreductase subunit C [Rhodothermaceae bacterium]
MPDSKSRPPQHETLKFHFTPVDPPKPGADLSNPHAKKTTFVPEVVEALRERFGDAVQEVTLYANEHTVRVDKARLVEIARFLREEQGFTYFVDCGGIDRFTEEDRYEVFYNLVNIDAGKRIRLKVRVDEDDMTVPSLTGVWRAANWNERECWDMFGIRFEGHPDLRRMYMPEDFEYHPLRKEFPLLGIPGSLPLPPQVPEGELTLDPFPAAHGSKPPKSYEEPPSTFYEEED